MAFSNDGLTLYAVAVISGQDSIFAAAAINLATNVHTWGITNVVCDMQFVTRHQHRCRHMRASCMQSRWRAVFAFSLPAVFLLCRRSMWF